MSSSSDYSELSGQKPARSPEKSTFSQTCNLLSQYIKEKGSFGDLTLGMTCNTEQSGSPETSCQSATTMNLFPTKENNVTPKNLTAMDLLSTQAAYRPHLQTQKHLRLTAVSLRRCNPTVVGLLFRSHGGRRMMEEKEKLNNYKVGSLPTLIYIPDFITDSEQSLLLNNIYGAPASKWKSLKNRKLQNLGGVVHEKGLLPQPLPPWLTNFTQKIYEESGLFPSAINHVLINEYLPNQGIMPHQDGPAYFPVVAILSLGSPVVMDFTPHARLKQDPQDVIDKDSDGGNFENGKDKWLDDHHSFSILLMPRSLLIFKDKAYSDYMHGIKDCAVHCYDGAINETEALNYNESNRPFSSSEEAGQAIGTAEYKNISRTSTRISLTCRLVPKVHKNLFRF